MWTAVPAPAPPSDANVDPNIVPSSLACADADDCAAVGTYINPLQNSLGLLFSESAAPGPAAPARRCRQTPRRRARSATRPSCSHPWRARRPATARPSAGTSTTTRTARGCSSTQNGGTWQPGVEVTLPANAVQGLEKQSAGLDWISCARSRQLSGHRRLHRRRLQLAGAAALGGERRLAAPASSRRCRATPATSSTRRPTSPTAPASATAP